jgi:predicted AAA+ superfamily ATPase
MIDRTIEHVLKELVTKYPVVTITGPRQSGKTTLCRKVFPEIPYENLEIPDVRQFALDDPRGFLSRYSEGVILDEIQRAPNLLSYIQGIVDEKQRSGQFILTGSQQFEVLNKISQSLAGRTALLKLLPLSLAEILVENTSSFIDRLILTGFYPRIYDQKLNPTQALGDYLATYVERDVRQLAAIKDLGLFEKFVKLCAGRVGQILNINSLANDVGVSHTTARSWLSILEAGYIVYLLPPWFRNISKRLIKSPKLYFYDVGLASYLLGLENELHVSRDPLRGHLFENVAVTEVVKYRFNRGLRSNLSFYRDSGGNEVDMIIEMGPDIFPVEVKAGETITNDTLKSLKKIAGLFPNLPWGGALLYGGNEMQIRSEVRIYPMTDVHNMLADIQN